MNTHRSIYKALTTNSRLVFGYNLIKLSDLDKSSAVDQIRMWTIEQTDNEQCTTMNLILYVCIGQIYIIPKNKLIFQYVCIDPVKLSAYDSFGLITD